MRTGSPRNATFKGQHRLEYAWFSISDSLPGLSMSAPRAAEKILAACRRGDAHVVLSLPAKLAALAHAVAPDLTARLMAQVDRFLPDAGGVETRPMAGYESQSAWSPSWLTALNERAARSYNEMHNGNGR